MGQGLCTTSTTRESRVSRANSSLPSPYRLSFHPGTGFVLLILSQPDLKVIGSNNNSRSLNRTIFPPLDVQDMGLQLAVKCVISIKAQKRHFLKRQLIMSRVEKNGAGELYITVGRAQAMIWESTNARRRGLAKYAGSAHASHSPLGRFDCPPLLSPLYSSSEMLN
jgi:hypothetical protein